MSTPRVALAATMVAAAWATAIGGVPLVGAAKAEAAWLRTGNGSSFAAALPLAAPTGFSAPNPRCNNSGGGPSVTVSWGYPSTIPLPPKFEVLISSTANDPNATVAATTTTAMTATITLPNTKTSYLSVRAVAGSWRLRSAEVSVC